jgi:acyl dehydratase
MSGPVRLWFEDVAAGDALPTIEFDVTLTSLVMYAGATWDFHRYHYDAAYVAERGHRAPFMDGQMVGALLTRQLMQWGGPDAFVRRLAFRLRTMVYAGDRISISGRVTGVAVEGGRGLALCSMDIDAVGGGSVVREATAAIELLRQTAQAG